MEYKIRLNLDISGGAWCPGKAISGSTHGSEWIQVKLNRSVVITAIETQGRFGMGSGKEFTPAYSIEYSRNGGLSWHKWRDYTSIGVLRGNDDVSTAVKNELTPPIVGANVIRILPFSQHLRTVCLRFELHGCTYDEGAPIAYSGPDGVIEGRWGHLIDTTYDGYRQHGHLHAGLGQLVDGIKGADNFSHNQGLEWVGWKKSKDGDLHLEFTFKTLRNFTGALFHSNNLFSSGVEALQAMDVHYGIDINQSILPLRDALEEPKRREAAASALSRIGRQASGHSGGHRHHQENTNNYAANSNINQHDNQQTVWSSNVLRIEYEPDKRLESARPVTVHLNHQLANKLKFVLKFASKWILISEVEFLSHPVELMSFASLSDQHTPQLLDALGNSKSYDEYVAILREHQLRRIAANAFFGISSAPSSSSPTSFISSSSSTPTSLNGEAQPDMSDDQPMPPAPLQPRLGSNTEPALGLENYNLPDYSGSNNFDNKQQSPYNRWQLNGGAQTPALPQIYPAIPSPSLFPPSAPATPEILFGGRTNGATNSQLPLPSLTGSSSTTTTTNQQQTLGLATVISLVIVAMILLISALIGLSRYHLNRQQPKMGFPGYPFGSPPSGAGSSSLNSSTGRKANQNDHLPPIKGLVSPLMSVFSQNNQANCATSLNNHPYQLEPYNTIFAPGHSASSSHSSGSNQSSSSSSAVRNTLGRLAAPFTSAGNNRHNTNARNQRQLQQAHQLLVSVKDTSGNSKKPFGYQTNGKDSAVSTQLIVGLNQANPLAHQQIYTNNSSMNCSQQTYGTQYTSGGGGASMASSSNQIGGLSRANLLNNQDHHIYNEYATPEFGPSPQLVGRTEMMRSSCRAPPSTQMSGTMAPPVSSINNMLSGPNNGNHFHNNSFTLSNRQHQQLNPNHHFNNLDRNVLFSNHNNSNCMTINNQNGVPREQHNYELIYHESTSDSTTTTDQPQPIHTRTLSKQMRFNHNGDDDIAQLVNANVIANGAG